MQTPTVIRSSTAPTLPRDTSRERLELLLRVGVQLAAERDRQSLLELILSEARALCRADGGTLYLREQERSLSFAIVQNQSLGIYLGGSRESRPDFPPVQLYLENGEPNLKNIASYAFHQAHPVHVEDAYAEGDFDFSGTQAFDKLTGYRSKSLFTVPLVNGEGQVIGVLQLLNARTERGEVVPFLEEDRETVAVLAAQAALALDNQLLLLAQKELLESFIKLIASAIDSKSPYTGGHCERVPVLTELLMQAVCQSEAGPFAQFRLTDEEWYEVKIAAWLHDCGKVTTPVHVMDKATKLETISDRISAVLHRFEILERDERIQMLEALAQGENPDLVRERYEKACQELRDEAAFLERVNVGGEFLSAEAQDRVVRIAKRTYEQGGQARPLLDEDELRNLCISRGTLTEEERLVINGHIVETIRMLEALPFPRNLAKVPEYAGGHHEKMDGTGYPRGLHAGDMSVVARAMAIADVFEALTADDRPYKKAKKLSEAMRIMGFMKKDAHLDPELFDLFVRSGVYRQYAQRFLDASLIDEVDEAALLAIQPTTKSGEQPHRSLERGRFLPEYEARFPAKRQHSGPTPRGRLRGGPA